MARGWGEGGDGRGGALITAQLSALTLLCKSGRCRSAIDYRLADWIVSRGLLSESYLVSSLFTGFYLFFFHRDFPWIGRFEFALKPGKNQ